MHQVVGRDNFDKIVESLNDCSRLALDTETFGLRPYHGHRLFSIAIARSGSDVFYFNYQYYEGISPLQVLSPHHIQVLQRELFSKPNLLWFIQNAKYDMAILANEDCFLKGDIHCTKAIGRVEYNEHYEYDLENSLKRIGLAKDDAAEKWIRDNNALTTYYVPGRVQKKEDLHYFKVPFEIISKYAMLDAGGTFVLGETQIDSIQKKGEEIRKTASWGYLPENVMKNERQLTKTVFNMERAGLMVDLAYCKKAADYENAREKAAIEEYEKVTGKTYKDSNKEFQEIFAGDRPRWKDGKPSKKTGKVNPSFESEVLRNFENPAAKHVLAQRDAKSRSNFYTGFSYHADSNAYVHPNLNPDGAAHGRFSSSDPNFQNLTGDNVQFCKACGHEHEEILKECEECGSTDLHKKQWLVRQAIIPPPGYFIAAPDYDSMEYRFALNYACDFDKTGLTTLAKRVLEGEDVHTASAILATEKALIPVKRSQAKRSNFLMLYGGGPARLAEQLGIKVGEAAAIRRAISKGAPELERLIEGVSSSARRNGYIRNWYGRVCYFPEPRFAYKATNYLISGGCADVVKVAMNRLAEFLIPYQSRLVLQVHDELIFYIKYGEEHLLPEIKKIMEGVYTAPFIPLLCSMYVSHTNLAEMEEWHEA